MLFGSATTVGELVEAAATRFGKRTAVRMAGGIERSYAEIADRTRRLGAALAARGLRAGDRVAVLSKNRIECLEVLFSSLAGFVPVPLNWRLAAQELKLVIDDCAPAAIIADRTFRPVIDDMQAALQRGTLLVALDESGGGWLDYQGLIASSSAAGVPSPPQAPERPACLIYTSGTTGRPKGCERSHADLLANCRAAAGEVLHLTDSDVGLTAMPLFHVGGMWYHAFPSFAAGSSLTILPEFRAGDVLRWIAEHRVTHIHVVPTMLHAMIEHPSLAELDISSLRSIFYAGSSIPVELLKRAQEKLAGCNFIQGYGSSEAGMVSFLSPADHRAAADRPALLESCGRAMEGVELRIDPVAGSGEGLGEILVRSPMTMRRYWRSPSATEAAIEDGFVRTGDIGFVDADGYVSILDRKGDMIVTGGENVFPREVEEALLADPAVAEAAVFDLPDPVWVQRVVAAVVPRDGQSPDAAAIIARTKAMLAAYKCPKQIFIMDELPKSGAGKVLRKSLRALHGKTPLQPKE